MPKRNYSRVIHELRTVYGLNLVEIGQRTRIDPRTIGKWAHGVHQPNAKNRKKINKLYREVRTMNNQNKQEQVLQVVATQQFGNKTFKVYGSAENPVFVAVEVADMIGYDRNDINKMMNMVSDEEKTNRILFWSGQRRSMNMLTEFGVYEVLMQSRKPLAKEFKRVVKHVLKEIRLNGYYMQGELVSHAPHPSQPRISVDAECDYLDRLAQALLDADNRADKLTEIRKMHTFASVMMGGVDFTQYTLSYAQK